MQNDCSKKLEILIKENELLKKTNEMLEKENRVLEAQMNFVNTELIPKIDQKNKLCKDLQEANERWGIGYRLIRKNLNILQNHLNIRSEYISGKWLLTNDYEDKLSKSLEELRKKSS